MRKFHHIGLITTEEKPGENYFESLKVYGTSPDDDPNKIEWVRFTGEGPLDGTAVSQGPHISYQVDDIEAELGDRQCVAGPLEVVPGVRIAYFWEDEILVEYLEVKEA